MAFLIKTNPLGKQSDAFLISNTLKTGVKDSFSLDTKRLKNLLPRAKESTMNSLVISSSQSKNLELQLFEATSKSKTLISQISMHFSAALRNKLHNQLDMLHDPAEWPDDETPLKYESFYTLLRFLLNLRFDRYPNLGLTSDGNIIATWTVNKNTLIIECLPRNNIKWSLNRNLENYDQPIRASGFCNFALLEQVLAPYNPEIWFNRDE